MVFVYKVDRTDSRYLVTCPLSWQFLLDITSRTMRLINAKKHTIVVDN